MARAGRKRNLKAKRRQTTVEGQGRRVRPTREHLARREAMTGTHQLPADCPIACLYGKGYITEEQYNAGWAYFGLYCSVYGLPHPRTTQLIVQNGLDIGREKDPERENRIQERLRRIETALLDEGQRPMMEAVKNASIFWQFEFDPTRPLTREEKAVVGLIDHGLSVIDQTLRDH